MSMCAKRLLLVGVLFLSLGGIWVYRVLACNQALTLQPLIRVNQIGYRADGQKVAVLSDPQDGYDSALSYNPGTTLAVRRVSNDLTVFSGEITQWNSGATQGQSGDKGWWFDFSSVTTPGMYYIADVTRGVKSDNFMISNMVYYEVLKAAVRMFYYNRSGIEKLSTHAGANWADDISFQGAGQDGSAQDVTNKVIGTAKDLSGGWFDAGDYNKYTYFAYRALDHLLHAYDNHPTLFADNWNIPESGNGTPDLLDEAKYELDWLLKMQAATGNGSVLSKVSIDGFDYDSPPSADDNPKFWGEASTISTACTAAVFAHAAIIFSTLDEEYADDLETAAVAAYDWATSNPNVTYNNEEFESAPTEPDPTDMSENGGAVQNAYRRLMCRVSAAAYLYGLTGSGTYKSFFESNYDDALAITNNYWSPFSPDVYINHALLFYSEQVGITAGVGTAIQNALVTAMQQGNNESYGHLDSATDLYRSYMHTGEWVWGSNEIKSSLGANLCDLIRYNLDSSNHTKAKNTAQGYLNYILGTNPNGIVYLTNMYSYGAERAVNESWHMWFKDGGDWDNALTSAKGPAPGFLVGGPNEYFSGSSAVVPPGSQPIAKKWLDSNADSSGSFPIWEITEAGIYYQAAFVNLLSCFATAP